MAAILPAEFEVRGLDQLQILAQLILVGSVPQLPLQLMKLEPLRMVLTRGMHYLLMFLSVQVPLPDARDTGLNWSYLC